MEERFDTIDAPPSAPSRSRGSTSWQVPRPVREHIPNGRLMLFIRGYYNRNTQTWVDGKRRALEQCLASVVVAIEDAAESNRLERLEKQRREEAAREAQRRWLAEERRKAHRHAMVDDLDKRLGQWAAAARIRRFADAVEARLAAATEAPADPAVVRWIAWARDRADQIELQTVADLPDPALGEP